MPGSLPIEPYAAFTRQSPPEEARHPFAALGAVAQGSTVVPGWDAAVTREGATVTNDPAFAGVLDPVGVVSPTDLPAADALRSMGLASVTGS